MNEEKKKYYQKLFLTLKEKYINSLSLEELKEYYSGPKEKGDEMDRVLQERDRSMALQLKSRGDFFLKKINLALYRIDQGTFGVCDDCGAEIEDRRLRARPTASLCISCKEEEEREEQQRIQGHKRASTKNMGKVIQWPLENEKQKEGRVLPFQIPTSS